MKIETKRLILYYSQPKYRQFCGVFFAVPAGLRLDTTKNPLAYLSTFGLRIVLRPFEESDYDDLYEFLSQLERDEFEGYPGITYENGREHLKYRIGSAEFFAIELKESGKVIGNIYCGKRDFEAREVGYIVNQHYQRLGYASEALSSVIQEFLRNGTHRIYAECDPRNTGSWKLLEKVGMKREALFHKNIYFHKGENGNPIWKDTCVYAAWNE